MIRNQTLDLYARKGMLRIYNLTTFKYFSYGSCLINVFNKAMKEESAK